MRTQILVVVLLLGCLALSPQVSFGETGVGENHTRATQADKVIYQVVDESGDGWDTLLDVTVNLDAEESFCVVVACSEVRKNDGALLVGAYMFSLSDKLPDDETGLIEAGLDHQSARTLVYGLSATPVTAVCSTYGFAVGGGRTTISWVGARAIKDVPPLTVSDSSMTITCSDENLSVP